MQTCSYTNLEVAWLFMLLPPPTSMSSLEAAAAGVGGVSMGGGASGKGGGGVGVSAAELPVPPLTPGWGCLGGGGIRRRSSVSCVRETIFLLRPKHPYSHFESWLCSNYKSPWTASPVPMKWKWNKNWKHPLNFFIAKAHIDAWCAQIVKHIGLCKHLWEPRRCGIRVTNQN